jgi:hypothetical protein
MPIARPNPEEERHSADLAPVNPPANTPRASFVRPIETGICRGCGKPTVFLHRPEGKLAPADPKPVVFIVTVDDNQRPFGTTLNEFLAKVESFQLKPTAAEAAENKPGRVVPAEKIRSLMVTHYATCPEAGQLSRRSKKHLTPVEDGNTGNPG